MSSECGFAQKCRFCILNQLSNSSGKDSGHYLELGEHFRQAHVCFLFAESSNPFLLYKRNMVSKESGCKLVEGKVTGNACQNNECPPKVAIFHGNM